MKHLLRLLVALVAVVGLTFGGAVAANAAKPTPPPPEQVSEYWFGQNSINFSLDNRGDDRTGYVRIDYACDSIGVYRWTYSLVLLKKGSATVQFTSAPHSDITLSGKGIGTVDQTSGLQATTVNGVTVIWQFDATGRFGKETVNSHFTGPILGFGRCGL